MTSSKLKCVLFRCTPSHGDNDILDNLSFPLGQRGGCGFINSAKSFESTDVIDQNSQTNGNGSKQLSQDLGQDVDTYDLNCKIFTIYTDSEFGSAVGYTCKRSRTFLKLFIKYCKQHGSKQIDKRLASGDQIHRKYHTVISVYMRNPKRYWLDYIWYVLCCEYSLNCIHPIFIWVNVDETSKTICAISTW